MIEVEIRLKSAISSSRDKVLGTMIIANDGAGTARKGNYICQTKARKGTVLDYPRLDVSVWNLIRRACEACGYVK